MLAIALRLAFALVAVAATPLLGLGLARFVLGFRGAPTDAEARGSRWLVLRSAMAGGVALAIPLGANALGTTRPYAAPTRALSGAVILALVAVVGLVLRKARRDLGLLEGRPAPLSTLSTARRIELGFALVLGGGVALAAGRRLGVEDDVVVPIAYVTATAILSHGIARHPLEGAVTPRLFSVPTLVALGLSLLPALAAVGLYTSTRIARSDVLHTDGEVATRRVFLVPHDAIARLALAWADARDGHVENARQGLRDASDVGAERADVLVLESDLHARSGDCDAARAAFQRALAIRAEEHLARVLAERLPLGEFQLPPSLVSRCGLAPTPR